MQRSAKIPTMGCTWRTAHCRDFLLAAADVCLIVRNYLLYLLELYVLWLCLLLLCTWLRTLSLCTLSLLLSIDIL